VGAENLCHQAIIMNHASGTVTRRTRKRSGADAWILLYPQRL
jgi:hypothetical protein